MTDLTEKLREIAEWTHNDFLEINDIGPVIETARDAANEIQRLRNALAIIANVRQDQYARAENARSFALAALEPGSQFPCLSSDEP